MAPPRTSTAPLLADLGPLTVATDVCRLVLDHLSGYVIPLAPVAEVHVITESGRNPTAQRLAESSDLGLSVQALTLYAKNGLPVWDWEDSGCAADACLTVFSALYSQAGDPNLGGGVLDAADVEPENAIGVVLLAALGRIHVDQRAPVSARELAVLSGLSTRQVYTLAKAGELPEFRDGGIPAKDARRWLEARGLPGFAPRKR